MKSHSKIHEKSKAISPVIATVILVSVTITVAIAVSYWMAGISSQYTAFEKIEIQSAISVWNDVTKDWDISMKLKNTGTASATLISIFINEIEVDWYTVTIPADGEATTDMGATVTITSGASVTVKIYIDGPGDPSPPETIPATPKVDYWQSVSAGTTINIKIHSAGGMDYIKLLELV